MIAFQFIRTCFVEQTCVVVVTAEKQIKQKFKMEGAGEDEMMPGVETVNTVTEIMMPNVRHTATSLHSNELLPALADNKENESDNYEDNNEMEDDDDGDGELVDAAGGRKRKRRSRRVASTSRSRSRSRSKMGRKRRSSGVASRTRSRAKKGSNVNHTNSVCSMCGNASMKRKRSTRRT